MRNPVVSVLVPALALIAALPAVAHARAPEAWKVTVVPYLLGAGMSGTSAVKDQELTVEASASDIFSNLQFGAMGLVVARKGAWGVGGDAIWMSLGANLSKNASLEFGYRWLDIDYSSGEELTLFRYDVLTQGPVIGSAFRF